MHFRENIHKILLYERKLLLIVPKILANKRIIHISTYNGLL